MTVCLKLKAETKLGASGTEHSGLVMLGGAVSDLMLSVCIRAVSDLMLSVLEQFLT